MREGFGHGERAPETSQKPRYPSHGYEKNRRKSRLDELAPGTSPKSSVPVAWNERKEATRVTATARAKATAKGRDNTKCGKALVMGSVRRKPRKNPRYPSHGTKSRDRKSGGGECGADHLSVIGAGGQEGKRDEIL